MKIQSSGMLTEKHNFHMKIKSFRKWNPLKAKQNEIETLFFKYSDLGNNKFAYRKYIILNDGLFCITGLGWLLLSYKCGKSKPYTTKHLYLRKTFLKITNLSALASKIISLSRFITSSFSKCHLSHLSLAQS